MKNFKILLVVAIANLSLPTFAQESTPLQDSSKMQMNMTKEDREKMAVAHDQMSVCLRSGKELEECHDQLQAECQASMGGACSGMEMKKGMHRKMNMKK